MHRLLLFGIIISMLGACTTERVVVEPEDRERASEINAQLGLGYMQHGQYERALRKIKKAIEYNPENAHAYHYRAELYRRLREYDKAEENYKQSLDIDPKDANTLNNYGIFLCDQGRYEEAYANFRTIIEDPLYKYKADAYENLGLCSYRQGKLQQAEQAFENALAINGKMSKSILKMAQLTYDRRQKAEAYSYFKRYLGLAPHNAESLWLGILMETDRRNKNTVASYKVLLKGKFPASKEAKLLKQLEAEGKI